MVRTLLYMAVCVPALGLAQVDSVQDGREKIPSADSIDTLAPGDSSGVPSTAADRRDSGEREAVLEGREVVTSRRGTSGLEPVSLGRAELSRHATLADALAGLPGVEVRRTGGIGGYAEVALRQCPSQQVRVVVDGVPWKDQGSSSVDLGQFLTDGLERVQVLQGASPGSDGVPELRIQTRSAWLRRGASLGAGSFGERAASAWWGDREGRWSASAWLQTARNDWPIRWDRGTPYNPKDDTVVALANNDFTGYGVGLAGRPGQEWLLSLRAERAEKGGTGLYVAHPNARWTDHRIQARVETSSEEVWSLPVSAGVRWSASDWSDSGASLDYRSNRSASQTAWSGEAGGGLRREAGDWLDFRLGLRGRGEFDRWSTTTPKEIRLTPDAGRLAVGVSGAWSGRAPDGGWGAEAALRQEWIFDRASVTENGMAATDAEVDSSFRRSASDANARVWVRPDRSAWSSWIGVAASQRVPDFYELYGDNGLTFTATGLRPERNAQVEIGTGWNAFGVAVRSAAWGAVYQDPIRRRIIGASTASRFENDSGYQAVGWEFDAQACGAMGSVGVRLDLSRTWLESEYAALRGHEIEKSPRWKANVSTETPRWKGLVLQGWIDAAGSSWASVMNRPDDRINGRLLWNAGLVWSRGVFRAALQGLNLGDRRFEEFENAPMSGRAWRLQVQVDFDTNGKDDP